MKTKEQLEQNFRKDFEALLLKYDAEYEVTDDGKSYGMHSGICVITIPNQWDENGNTTRIFCEFNL